MAFCIPAWGSGFCDGHSPSGGSDCRQTDGSYAWGEFGPAVANYRDLDPGVVVQGDEALEFSLDFHGLPGELSRNRNHIVVFELAVIGMTQARTLALGIRTDHDQRTLEIDWWQADPYWSTASIPLATTTLEKKDEYAFTTGVTSAHIRIAPLAGWGQIAVEVDGNVIGPFVMPQESSKLGSSTAARMRSGVISANPLQPNMAVSFDFDFPQQ
jgi:hypothetical protein